MHCSCSQIKPDLLIYVPTMPLVNTELSPLLPTLYSLPPLCLLDNFVRLLLSGFCYLLQNTIEISSKFLKVTVLLLCAKMEVSRIFLSLVHSGLMIIFTNFDQIYRKLYHQNVDGEPILSQGRLTTLKRAHLVNILVGLSICV